MGCRLLKRKVFAPRFRFCLVVISLLVVSSCAYEVSTIQGVARPGKIRTLERIAVAPFRYPSDWTGLFRDVYAQAGLKAPEGKKIELIDGAFSDSRRPQRQGVYGSSLAEGTRKNKSGRFAERGRRNRGRPFGDIERFGARRRWCWPVAAAPAQTSKCVRRGSKYALLDLGFQEELWESEAGATTVLSQGDEMKAAVSEALDEFPRQSSDSG